MNRFVKVPARLMSMSLVMSMTWLVSFPAGAGNASVVEEFVAAFNAQDVARMLAVADENIEWFYVDGGNIQQETSGKAELATAMTSYFESCPTCRATVSVNSVHDEYLAAVETASWQVEGETRRQSSLVVYRIVDGRIRSVWYYPAS